MSEHRPNDEQEFLDRLRNVWQETDELPDPPREATEYAKGLYVQRQKKQPTRRLPSLILLVIALGIGILVLIYFLRLL